MPYTKTFLSVIIVCDRGRRRKVQRDAFNRESMYFKGNSFCYRDGKIRVRFGFDGFILDKEIVRNYVGNYG